ncbi:MAG: AraC family transcriptional regulator, partial [Saprospiraceae bacterium]
MRKKIQSFSGIFGDHEAPFKRYFLHHEPLQTRSALYNYEITEHLHTQLVQIFLITSGSGLLLS